jgi:hypothetical protein
MVMTTDREHRRTAEEWNRIDRGERARDRDEPQSGPVDKTDSSQQAPPDGPGSEPPD